jgi:hypothetical protein
LNLLITIFGGMLLTVLLYGGGRALRLSNFWAAVLACALPSFAYVAHAVAVWPGLDVVTIHVVAYPTVAVLLYQLYGSRAGHELNVHWAPKLMIIFFVLITVIFGGFVYIAGQGLPPALARLILPGAKDKNIHTGFAGVVAHGEDAAKGIGHHLGMEASWPAWAGAWRWRAWMTCARPPGGRRDPGHVTRTMAGRRKCVDQAACSAVQARHRARPSRWPGREAAVILPARGFPPPAPGWPPCAWSRGASASSWNGSVGGD